MEHEVVKSGKSVIISGASKQEKDTRASFVELYKQNPIPDFEVLDNLNLFIKRQSLSRMLMLNDMYKQIVNLHGIVCEFGVRWGNNLALYESFRGMYEPYNWNRKIVGFDTWEGFPSVHKKDGIDDIIQENAYSTIKGYEEYLEKILSFHETESPISHKKKFELVKGDATVTIKKYLKDHPETIIAFAYFDFDIYEPTKVCLEAIKPHLTKGAIIGFDELNLSNFPGETLAFDEVLGINNCKIHKDVNNPMPSYIVYE